MVDVDGAKVPVAVFGKGKKNLILLPGVGDPDEEMLDGLVTTVDISLLKDFIEKGGEIFLLSDENR